MCPEIILRYFPLHYTNCLLSTSTSEEINQFWLEYKTEFNSLLMSNIYLLTQINEACWKKNDRIGKMNPWAVLVFIQRTVQIYNVF